MGREGPRTGVLAASWPGQHSSKWVSNAHAQVECTCSVKKPGVGKDAARASNE